MQNKIAVLLESAGLSIPPVGVYDVPDIKPFQPFASPAQCIFECYANWLKGESTVIDRENAATIGCPGAGYWLCGIESMPKAEVAGYLAGQQGLKSSVDTMRRWLENSPPYRVENGALVISHLKDEQYGFLKSVTFFITPDQLGLFLTGAEYRNTTPDRRPVIAPYGSGCGQLLAMFRDLDAPQAMIGATDIAMRKYLPPEILTFTVTKPMLEQLCDLDGNSFLNGVFWKDLRDARQSNLE